MYPIKTLLKTCKNYSLTFSTAAIVGLGITFSYIPILNAQTKPQNASTRETITHLEQALRQSRFASTLDQKSLNSAPISTEQAPDPNRALLPATFKVYIEADVGVVNVPYPGLEERLLPTVNDFVGYPGCYVAAYSHRVDNSAYSVGEDIYVMGQVRVPGRYQGRICQPQGYEGVDISAQSEFGELFAEKLPVTCSAGCWAGGDTGGWFGLPFQQ